MKFFKKSHDGGKDSGVTGYWVIEWKKGFSIVFLRFSEGSREAFHEHAFNAWTWWLKGEVVEQFLDGRRITWKPSWKPKYTPKKCFHKIISKGTSFAISFRGPWEGTWKEHKNGDTYTLTHGRRRVD
jgi:hypothetical protein